MNKKTAALLMSLLIALSAVSCGDSSSPSEDESSKASVTSSAEATQSNMPPDSSEPEKVSESEPEPGYVPMSTPYDIVDGFEAKGRVSSIAVSSDGKAAITCISSGSAQFYIVDPKDGRTLRSGKLTNEGDRLLGLRPDGTAVFQQASANNLYLLSEGSDQPRMLDTIPATGSSFKYDPASDRLISYRNSITELDMDTGSTTELIKVREELDEIADVDLKAGCFIANELSAEQNGTLKPGVFSLSDGSKLGELSLYDNSLLYLTKNYIVNDDQDTDQRLFLTYDRNDGSALDSFVSPSEYSVFYSSPYSDYLMLSASNNTGDGWETYLRPIDLVSGTVGELHFEGDMLTMFIVTASPSGRWFGAMSTGNSDDDLLTRIVMLEPSLAENVTGLEKVSFPAPVEKELHTADEWLTEQRKRADAIEEKYGVRIAIGDEINNIAAPEYELVPQTSENSTVYDVDNGLEQLDKALSRYPEGFFEKFRLPSGGGLRFAQVESLTNTDEYSTFEAGGMTFQTGAWINIAYDAASFASCEEDYHHEIWHAAELLVSRKTPFNEDEWSKLDPEGFAYDQGFNTYDGSSSWDDHTIGRSSDPYFVRSYSTLHPQEDRATIIEGVMTPDRKVSYEELCRYTHIKAKLDYLAEWIKPYFGYVYFEP